MGVSLPAGRRALDALIGDCLPLVYNVVGWALEDCAAVEDTVRETLLRAVRTLPDRPAEPDGFRRWTLSAAMELVRDERRAAPAVARTAGFTDLAVLRLGLSGQRWEAAEATRWLEPEDRDVLSVWWVAAAGGLSRAALCARCGITPQHATVRIQRMKARLDAARAGIRAMVARPGCAELWVALGGWDGVPSPLWRKRIARHTRECPRCCAQWDLIAPAEELLAGTGLVPVPPELAALAAAVTHPSVSHPTVVE